MLFHVPAIPLGSSPCRFTFIPVVSLPLRFSSACLVAIPLPLRSCPHQSYRRNSFHIHANQIVAIPSQLYTGPVRSCCSVAFPLHFTSFHNETGPVSVAPSLSINGKSIRLYRNAIPHSKRIDRIRQTATGTVHEPDRSQATH